MRKRFNRISQCFHLAGIKYWPASFLPALMGTTLPFWLQPRGFTFKLYEAVLFLVATILSHAGFSLLYNYLKIKHTSGESKIFYIIYGLISIIAAVITGFYLNNLIQLNNNVYRNIFLTYGILVVFTGLLYLVTAKYIFSEITLSIGLGMMPVIGAYLIQAGDLTRSVYLASLPVVVSTALWIWITELIDKEYNEKSGYKTTVMYFKYNFSSRIITLFLIILIYISLVLAVFGRSSLNPLSLIALFSIIFALLIIKIVCKDHENVRLLQKAEKYAFIIHLSVCIVIILASLSSVFY